MTLRRCRMILVGAKERLYATEDWSSLSELEPWADCRLYSCKCQYWGATDARSIENDHDSPSEPNVSWVCGGHPLPTLPLTLGELRVDVDTDWDELVDRILGGVCPRRLELAAGECEGPAQWLHWLYPYLEGLPVAEQLSRAVSARVDDEDPRVVGHVLDFFTGWPSRAPGGERVLAVAESAPERVAVGYPILDSPGIPTLWDVVIACLRHRSLPPDKAPPVPLRARSRVVPQGRAPSACVRLARERGTGEPGGTRAAAARSKGLGYE